MIIPFATQSYTHRSLPISAQRCVNAYAEREPQDAKTHVAVLGSPGVSTFATLGSGPVRGLHVMGGVLYAVSGGTLYSVSSLGVGTALGGTILGSSPVSMADNGSQLCIVNGTNGYIYSATIGFVVITDINFRAAATVTFFDNVFVFDRAGTNQFFVSNNLDGTTYSALGFASAEVSSPNLLACVNQQENLLLFCGNRIEIWYDAGTVNMPFLRVDGGVIERGCAAALTPVKEDNSVFFLGDDLVYYRLNNMSPQRISTHAIESAWQKYATVSDAVSFSYTHEGHKFIVVNFPAANASWTFDIATGLWHERNSWDMFNNPLGRWRGNCMVKAYGLNLVGDAFSGVVGSLDAAVFTEFGATMQAYMVAPPIHMDRKRVFISRFELDIDSGVGLVSGQGSNPQIMLQWSKDNGRTFSAQQEWQSMGILGAYAQRLRWLKLGQARQWCFAVTISDPVRRTIMASNADLSLGM